jgi:hypothetical protein
MVERKPSSSILVIPAVLLETERAIGAHEDIDAMVARVVFEGCHDPDRRRRFQQASNVPLDPPKPAERSDDGIGRGRSGG